MLESSKRNNRENNHGENEVSGEKNVEYKWKHLIGEQKGRLVPKRMPEQRVK